MSRTHLIISALVAFTVVRVVIYGYAVLSVTKPKPRGLLYQVYIVFETVFKLLCLFLWITWLKVAKAFKKT